MKLKATISLPGEHFSDSQRYSLAQLVKATNSRALHQDVYEKALTSHLRVRDFGPAEYFTQLSDRMTPVNEGHTIGFDVTLSGVSVTARRSQQDFWDGLQALSEIYQDIAARCLTTELGAQLFTRMALDKPIDYLDRPGATSLLEIGPTIVNGTAKKENPSKVQLTTAELEALLGDSRTVIDLYSLKTDEGGSRTNTEMGR